MAKSNIHPQRQYIDYQKKISESELEGSALSLPRKSFALGTDGGSPIALPPFVPYAATSAVPSSASCYLETIFGSCYKQKAPDPRCGSGAKYSKCRLALTSASALPSRCLAAL
jgi:hypothetical protein